METGDWKSNSRLSECVAVNCDNCCGDNAETCKACVVCCKDMKLSCCHKLSYCDVRTTAKKTVSRENLQRRMPIINWLPKYSISSFVRDAISGVTVALMVLPTSIAFAEIANLPSEYGIYSAYLCCFVYTVMGSARDLNLGPAAVLSLLVQQFASSPVEDDPTYAIFLTLVCGVIQLVLALCRLDIISEYISLPVIESFTTVSVITIAFGQLQNWLNLKDIPHKFLQQVYWTFAKLPETDLDDFLMGLASLIVLLILKKSKTHPCIAEKSQNICVVILKKFIWFCGVARNAIVVILGGATAYILTEYYNSPDTLEVIGYIPPGLPIPQIPNFSVTSVNGTYYGTDMLKQFGMGILIVPIIGYIEALAIARSIGQRNGYDIDPNQELYTIGFSNIIGSFFSAYPITGTFSGSSVNYQSGVKTTAGSFWTGCVILLAVFVMTPWFYYIPKATLAVVVIAAVLDLTDFRLVVELWYINAVEIWPWTLTFILALAVEIQVGLIVGVIVSFFIIIFPFSKTIIKESHVKEDANFVIVLQDGLNFPSTSSFKKVINKKIKQNQFEKYRKITVDFKEITSIDYTFVEGLKSLITVLLNKGIKLELINISPSVKAAITHANVVGDLTDVSSVDTDSISIDKEKNEISNTWI